MHDHIIAIDNEIKSLLSQKLSDLENLLQSYRAHEKSAFAGLPKISRAYRVDFIRPTIYRAESFRSVHRICP